MKRQERKSVIFKKEVVLNLKRRLVERYFHQDYYLDIAFSNMKLFHCNSTKKFLRNYYACIFFSIKKRSGSKNEKKNEEKASAPSGNIFPDSTYLKMENKDGACPIPYCKTLSNFFHL